VPLNPGEPAIKPERAPFWDEWFWQYFPAPEPRNVPKWQNRLNGVAAVCLVGAGVGLAAPAAGPIVVVPAF